MAGGRSQTPLRQADIQVEAVKYSPVPSLGVSNKALLPWHAYKLRHALACTPLLTPVVQAPPCTVDVWAELVLIRLHQQGDAPWHANVGVQCLLTLRCCVSCKI